MHPFSHIHIAFTERIKESATQRTAMRDATVRSFLAVLSGLLTKYDRQESAKESKRGYSPNIYRLSHLLGAAHKVEADVKPYLNRDDPEAMEALRQSLAQRFTPGFRPINMLLRRMSAWEISGVTPKYGSVQRVAHLDFVFAEDDEEFM